MWSILLICVALLQIGSFFLNGLLEVANIVARITGIITVIFLSLILLAGTIGGSFHLSPSNQILCALMALLSLSGFTAFFWERTKLDEDKINQE